VTVVRALITTAAAAVPASMVRRVNLGIGFSPRMAVPLSLDALDVIVPQI
jgi:hypothetical protein